MPQSVRSINQDDHLALLQEAQVLRGTLEHGSICIRDHQIDTRIARGLDGLHQERLVGDPGILLRL